MIRNILLSSPLCLAIFLTGSSAHAQFGGVQVRIGNYGNGLSLGVGSGYAYGNPYYGSTYYGNSYYSYPYGNTYYGNSYYSYPYGNTYYGNSYYGNPYYGNSYYGNSYRNYGPGVRYNNSYYGNGFRYQTPRYYSAPYRGVPIRRYGRW